MQRRKEFFLPEVNAETPPQQPEFCLPDTPCPCCGTISIPSGGDAPAFICPHCFWEIDPFLHAEDEPSDLNHGITLRQARENYAVFGVCAEKYGGAGVSAIFRILPSIPKRCAKSFVQAWPRLPLKTDSHGNLLSFPATQRKKCLRHSNRA